jgi:hypothetical protein
MAKKKLFKSKTNFTLRRLHQSGNYGNIYERDYTTVSNFPSDSNGQLSIYNGPSFKLSVSAGLNRQKKYQYGNWLSNPQSCANNSNAWTLSCLPASNNDDSKIILKPNSRRLSDFACYGSAHELVRATLTNIVSNFPAELYVTNKKLSEIGIFTTDSMLQNTPLYDYRNLYIVENPFNIDLLQKVIPENSKSSPLHYFCESDKKYVVLNDKNEVIANGLDFQEWNDNHPNDLKSFYDVALAEDKNCLINGDLLAIVNFNAFDISEPIISIICIYYENNILYLSNKQNYHIRPNEKVINDFFNNLDDFGKVLLNQYTDYTSIFETYIETKNNGWILTEKKYKWPVGEGNWNLAINGVAYSNYIYDLTNLANGYDVLYTNAIWRDMVHESISNMDLTMISNGEKENIDSSKMKQMLNVVGRQFDEIKKYADNIKNTNKITYSQDSNTPDYFLPDNLELSGWETKEILNTAPNDIITDAMYGARTVGFSASDANNEFMRRLKLNSKQILAKKGTKQCIEDLMALFGYHSTDWLRRYYGTLQNKHLRKAFIAIEYVYVADGYAFNENADTICEEVKQLNVLKDNFYDNNVDDYEYNPYKGLPVAEVNYDNKTRLVPWFSKNCEYDSNLYFQMKGGWARNEGNGETDPHVYDYTITKVHYIPTLNDLYNLLFYTIDNLGVYFVGSTQTYYRLIDEENYNNANGWRLLNDDEIKQIENIVDNNKGNNPHTGNYDGGSNFYETLGELFKDSKFDNVRDDRLDLKFSYGFNIMRQADSTKCLFFNDNMISADDDVALLRGENKIIPYNFFDGGNYDESASLSVINSKELHIIFDDAHRDFLEKDVLPYLKQIIPSTTIFSYSFEHLDGDDSKLYKARTHKVICDGDICPIYGVV